MHVSLLSWAFAPPPPPPSLASPSLLLNGILLDFTPLLLTDAMLSCPCSRQEGLRSTDKATFMSTLTRLRETLKANVADHEAKASEAAAAQAKQNLQGLRASLSEKDALAAVQQAQLQDAAALEARIGVLEAELEAKERQVAELEQVLLSSHSPLLPLLASLQFLSREEASVLSFPSCVNP